MDKAFFYIVYPLSHRRKVYQNTCAPFSLTPRATISLMYQVRLCVQEYSGKRYKTFLEMATKDKHTREPR